VEHALLFCPFANEVWQVVKSTHAIHLRRKGFTSPRAWMLEFFDHCSELEATILAVSFWHIWDARNKGREGEGETHPKIIAAKIKAYIDMICTHLYKPKTASRRESSTSTPKWIPPPAGFLLVNVDAAIFASTRQMGVGVVTRDHNGAFVAACGERYAEVVEPELAEALALRRAVLFASEEGFTKVIFASDCLSVIQRVQSPLFDRSMCGPVTEDIKRMARSFEDCSFHHISRVCNSVAHNLARASEFSVDVVWRGVPPDCIRQDICNDIMIIDQ
jgi:hypothetical protein